MQRQNGKPQTLGSEVKEQQWTKLMEQLLLSINKLRMIRTKKSQTIKLASRISLMLSQKPKDSEMRRLLTSMLLQKKERE